MSNPEALDANLDSGGELKYEHIALDDDHLICLRNCRDEYTPWDWRVDPESPHITRFVYDVLVEEEDDDDDDEVDDRPVMKVGRIDGYVINNDGQDESVSVWDEADAMDADIEGYVACLMLELRAIEAILGGLAPQIEWFTRIVVIRHFQPEDGVDSVEMIVKAVAAVAMKEGPTLMMVDPREMPEFRKASSGKLRGRSHTASLMRDLGMVRMISCRSVWGWHLRHDTMSYEYSYDALVAAKKAGDLDEILEGLRPDEE